MIESRPCHYEEVIRHVELPYYFQHFPSGAAALLFSLAVPTRAQLAIVWLTAGDPGNAADTFPRGYGAVANSFRIMKYEFTNQQRTQYTPKCHWPTCP
jgi:hypothetical protein